MISCFNRKLLLSFKCFSIVYEYKLINTYYVPKDLAFLFYNCTVFYTLFLNVFVVFVTDSNIIIFIFS